MVPLLRATHLAPTLVVTGLGGGLALLFGYGTRAWLVVVAVLAGQATVGWLNDLVDVDRDQAAGRWDKPLVAGALTAPVVRAAVVVATAVCVVASVAIGVVAGLVHLAAVGSGWAYDLGLKRTRWSVLPYLTSFGLLPTFVALGAPGGGTPPWWLPAAGALLGGGAHFANVLPDLDDDAATGVRGLPQRLGFTGSLVSAAVLLGVGVLLVGVAPSGPAPALLRATVLIGLLCVAAALVAGLAGRRRVAFPAAMAATAAVLVGLLSAGADAL